MPNINEGYLVFMQQNYAHIYSPKSYLPKIVFLKEKKLQPLKACCMFIGSNLQTHVPFNYFGRFQTFLFCTLNSIFGMILG